MFSSIRNFFYSKQSAFVIKEVNHFRNIVVLENRQLSLQVEVQIGNKHLKEANVIAPYILLTYQDGSTQKKRILK
jgi:hypothetical protein